VPLPITDTALRKLSLHRDRRMPPPAWRLPR